MEPRIIPGVWDIRRETTALGGQNLARSAGAWGTLYDGVGSVKRHFEFQSRGARFSLLFSFPFLHLDQGSLLVNPAVDLVPPTIYSVTAVPTMIRCSDTAIARGSKAPRRELACPAQSNPSREP